MSHFLLVCGLLVFSALTSAAQTKLFLGRWDINVTTSREVYPQWMEVKDENGYSIRIQPRGGAVRPATGSEWKGAFFVITLVPKVGERPEILWELSMPDGKTFNGVQKTGGVIDAKIVGVRAPSLDREMPKAWTRPEKLFNGKDLSGWEPIANRRPSHWVAKDGELVNTESGANLKSTRKFDDFKLHIEFNCPEHGNSGLYLRGRYEIQIGTEGGKLPSHEMGAIYGFHAPAKEVPPRPDEWQTYDVTLVGRHVTVIHNGVTIHDNQEIEGITGGALDSNEEEPGPFFLQGDHKGLLRFRNITISVPKK
jgi:Domain of Unknown Function (DUF1080)